MLDILLSAVLTTTDLNNLEKLVSNYESTNIKIENVKSLIANDYSATCNGNCEGLCAVACAGSCEGTSS